MALFSQGFSAHMFLQEKKRTFTLNVTRLSANTVLCKCVEVTPELLLQYPLKRNLYKSHSIQISFFLGGGSRLTHLGIGGDEQIE